MPVPNHAIVQPETLTSDCSMPPFKTGAPPARLILVSGKDPLVETGGLASFVRSHARAAQAADFEPEIFCVSRTEKNETTDFGEIHRIRSPLSWVPRQWVNPFRTEGLPFHAPVLARAVADHLRGHHGTAVVHAFGFWGTVPVRVKKRLSNTHCRVLPLVSAFTTVAHEFNGKLKGINFNHRLWNLARTRLKHHWVMSTAARMERVALRDCDAVLVNYESVQKLIRKAYADPATVIKLPYTSETAFLPEESNRCAVPKALATLRPADAPLVVAVSRHDPRKGLDVLLRALALLRRQDIAFRACLVGSGELLAAHRQLAKTLQLGDTTYLAGWVPDVRDYLRQSDIFVLPSLEEGSGSVSLIEALKARNAVVASNLDGIPEDVTDGDSALLATPGDVSHLANQLAKVLKDPTLRERLKRRASEVFRDRFSPEAVTAALGRFYRQVLAIDGRSAHGQQRFVGDLPTDLRCAEQHRAA